LYYLGRTPEKTPDLYRARELAGPAADSGFTPAINLMAALSLAEGDSNPILGVWSGGEGNCFKWSQNGTDLKDILAMGNLASLYRRGLGTAQNLYYASSWAYAAATAKAPSVRAQNDMGFFYEQGVALARDLTEATRWYNLAATRNYPLARTNLERIRKKLPGPPVASDKIDF
jgi:TPR repeat protein